MYIWQVTVQPIYSKMWVKILYSTKTDHFKYAKLLGLIQILYVTKRWKLDLLSLKV